jgi:hypothetical protein
VPPSGAPSAFDLRDSVLSRDEQVVVSSLRAGGLRLQSVWDLVSPEFAGPHIRGERQHYDHLIPELIEHLRGDYHPVTRQGIVRSLAVPAARKHLARIADIYSRDGRHRNSQIDRAVRLMECASRTMSGLSVSLDVETNCWLSYRRAAADTIATLCDRDSVTVVLGLIEGCENDHSVKVLVAVLVRKLKRWRKRDPELVRELVLRIQDVATRDPEVREVAQRELSRAGMLDIE